MESFENKFINIRNSKDSEEINDFLIEISKYPKDIPLKYLDFFINNLDKKLLENIKLNLIYILGEVSKFKKLNNKYIDFLEESYFSSDRWVRNEVIQTFEEIAKVKKLPDKVFDLIAGALSEDYLPLKLNTLKALLRIGKLSDLILTKVITILDSKNSDLLDLCSKILQNHIHNPQELFDALNTYELFNSLDKNSIRSLLFIFFQSNHDLEFFKQLIEDSIWDVDCKRNFIKEIEVYSRILIKKH